MDLCSLTLAVLSIFDMFYTERANIPTCEMSNVIHTKVAIRYCFFYFSGYYAVFLPQCGVMKPRKESSVYFTDSCVNHMNFYYLCEFEPHFTSSIDNIRNILSMLQASLIIVRTTVNPQSKWLISKIHQRVFHIPFYSLPRSALDPAVSGLWRRQWLLGEWRRRSWTIHGHTDCSYVIVVQHIHDVRCAVLCVL